MNQNKLFALTRWRLASWYATVMGVILSLCGFGIYEAIAHAHWVTIDAELETVAGTLHDSLEPTLKQPGRLEPAAKRLLPNVCLVEVSCNTQLTNSERHNLGAIHQGDYYIRLVDHSERLVALAGFQPQGLSRDVSTTTRSPQRWQILKDAEGDRYQQISVALHTQDNHSWGYLQVGRSLKELDAYLANVTLILFLGLPIAMILVGGSSWWLAGRAMQPIYQSYRQIQQFTADAAHELRTPLAATQATVESALRLPHLFEPEARDILSTIDRQNQRLTQLVADLLLLARMERQALPMRRQMCCLNDMVSDLVEELAPLAIAAGVELHTDFRVQNLLHVLGDEEQLYRLVSNLIVNAIQYTPKRGLVTVILGCSNHQALIQIQDTGIGITPDEQKRIFDRFYRVNSDRSRNTGGSGLGLAIAQAIVQAHNGSLQLQSELGKGSTFTIRLSG
ncbi:two-component system sensor histidine kinase RppB [Chroococcidiopsis sp. CCMEE 29]|uniref:two-component system sensor histidine kinase RppB n=1 Tax=Chroococcidiopsis sp. CCMEE 29 TaxID=155894 RepID=UPI002021A5A0|nr:two-component system sensor histidine kinase RppB [Chroococcidiopsis sp. CCMEE 29]